MLSCYQTFYWIDDSPVLFNMMQRLRPFEFAMLQVKHQFLTSGNSFAQEISNIRGSKYINYTLSKLSYLRRLANYNNSSKYLIESCVAVFTTPVSNPVWLQIECSHSFQMMSYLCEHTRAPMMMTKTYLYRRRDVYCQTNKVYIDGKCWSVSRYRKLGLTNVTIANTIVSLNIMLTSWSFANTSRYSIRVSADKDHGCIERNGFEYQRLVSWRYNSNCASSNSTLHYLSSTNVSYIRNPCKTSSHFQCYDGTCILSSYVCDGYVDCLDKSDELNCTDVCTLRDASCYTACVPEVCVCGEMYYHCTSHECIPLNFFCDNRQDCEDSSDERFCHQNVMLNRSSLVIQKLILTVN